MATLRNKRKLAAVTRETQEEHPRNGQSRNTSVPRINEEIITQVSEQIEGRVTKKLSQDFSRTETRIFGALSKLDELLLNPHITTHSGTVPGTFRNPNEENQGTNEDDSQSDLHSEAGIIHGQTTRNFGSKDCRDMVTGVQGEILYCPDMVTRGSEDIRKGHVVMTAVQGRDSLLLLWIFLRKTKEGALHKSATILQREHPCDNWSRPDSVGPSAVGDEQ